MNPNRLNQFGEPLYGEDPPGQENNQQEPEENEVRDIQSTK